MPVLQQEPVKSTSSPSLSLTSTVLQPFELVSATAQGFNPSDTVGVYLDSANGYELGALFCDGTGTCAGSLFVPYQGVSQGNHTLLAIGSNNLQAQLAVRFIAGIKVRDAAYGTQGGPGTPLQLIGGAFQANETVQVYWPVPALAESSRAHQPRTARERSRSPSMPRLGSLQVTITSTLSAPGRNRPH